MSLKSVSHPVLSCRCRLLQRDLQVHVAVWHLATSITSRTTTPSGPRTIAGGLTTKIHATCDALGNPTGFHLTPRQAHDLDEADALLPGIDADTIIADKTFDADERVIQSLQQAGKTIVIPPKSNRKVTRVYDVDLYKARHLIENFFARLKQFGAIATRYDKCAVNFLGAIYLAASTTWLN